MPKVIKYERIPDLLFLPAIMCRDIRLASIVPIEKRKKEEPDVIIKSPVSGILDTVYRKSFLSKYRYTNGRKITLGAWRRNHKALVMAQCQELMYAMYIPPSFQLVIEDGENEPIVIDSTRKGLFLLCDSTTNGEINRDTPRIVMPKYFRKMFVMRGSLKKNIAHCTEIQEYLARKHNKSTFDGSDTDFKFNEELSSFGHNEVFEEPSLFDEPNEQQNQVVDLTVPDFVGPKITSNTNQGPLVDTSGIPEGQFKVIARVTHLDNIVGFVLMDSNGNKAEFNKRQMINFAHNKKLTNASVRLKNGREYLYGVGIKLAELPAIERQI